MSSKSRVVVFSHLRWNFVFQRPQHVLSRVARDYEVIFIEEPIHQTASPATWQITQAEPNLTVARLQSPVADPGFHRDQMPVLKMMTRELFRRLDIKDYIAWFYSPLALPLVHDLFEHWQAPRVIVYDCMDELSAFLNAPADLLSREAELLRDVDIVFTGGPSLYESKKSRHVNVHCFPSSVDANHLRKAIEPLPEPADQQTIPRPRLGYFGVIDERIDLPLLDAAASQRPDWQFVMVGPVVKIDQATLPRRDNIHYSRQKSYADLPAYLAGWEICLMPFARNDATRFIRPTKTLEYMAAEKPIVSTSIADVEKPYGGLVAIADAPEAFVAACERALSENAEDRVRRIDAMRAVLATTSWDRTAAEMMRLISDVIHQPTRLDDDRQPSRGPLGSHSPVVIIGAGPNGLSAAYHLGDAALLLERENRVGGWCRSIEKDGFTFDFAGHIMFSNDPYVHEMYETLLGDNVHWQVREAWIYSKNVYTRYPFQGSLFGLPADVIKECIVGAIEARFGSTTEAPKASTPVLPTNGTKNNGHPSKTNGHNSSVNRIASAVKRSKCQPNVLEDCCGDDALESTVPLGKPTHQESRKQITPSDNFENGIYRVWGAGIAKHFAIPYNQKLWAVPLREMETSWLGGRVPMPDLQEMIEGTLKPTPRPMGPNARFGYPLRGGFQSLMNGFLPHVREQLRTGSGLKRVSPTRRIVTLATGKEMSYDVLIGTMPLPALIRAMGDEAPKEIQQAASQLRHVSVRCVHLGVAREKLTDKHWIYYPEDTVFHRIFVQGNASPHCNPAGGFGLTCEITYSPQKPLPCDGEDLIERCIDECRRVGIIAPDDEVPVRLQVDLPFAYVVYDHARPKHVALLREWLAANDILLAGRYSEWEYYNSDHAFLAGKKAAERAKEVRARRTQIPAVVS